MSSTGFCSECGNQVWDYCREHPSATIDSIICDLDPIDTKIDLAIDKAAAAWKRDGNPLKLDANWSETAYSDLPSEAQKRISWDEFHNAIQATLEA